jgi:hypothetical protein
MTQTLEHLANKVRNHTMTPTERRAQRVSLIMGLRADNSTLTREKVEEILDAREGSDELHKS